MNVDDAQKTSKSQNKLKAIFERQAELKEKYHGIEETNGIGYAFVKGITFDIDDRRWQYLLKDFAWRSVEEIAEACESYQKSGNSTHTKEEVADSLHFLIELYLISGITPADITNEIAISGFPDPWRFLFNTCHTFQSYRQAVSQYITDLGMAMNCLKQKPWKQTHFETDLKLYRKCLIIAFPSWINIALCFGLNKDTAFDMYFKKSEVNKFRQRSKY